MGGCFSKKKASSSPQSQPEAVLIPVPVPATASASSKPLGAAAVAVTSLNNHALKPKAGIDSKISKGGGEESVEEKQKVGKANQEEESLVKKEIFVIKHRKSHDRERERRSPPPQIAPQTSETESANSSASAGGICNINTGTAVRTSSCTKEEVDAILIQCGRLSRSNSSGKAASSSRKYSGSKRSYDFDKENDNANVDQTPIVKKGNDSLCDDERARRRHSTRSSSQGRRRTPSRERDQQQRSGSRERGSSGGSRRVSRSPGRRSETTHGAVSGNATTVTNNRPGKMVSVPATVSSLVMDKSNNGGFGVEATTITANVNTSGVKRISVKRNVSEGAVGYRGAVSPRSQSPARTNQNGNATKGCNENQQQPTLSRNSSRKADQSPYRRNPLSEIDPNSLAYPQSTANKTSGCINKESINVINEKVTNYKSGSNGKVDTRVVNINVNSTTKEQRIVEELKTQPLMAGAENPKPQTLTRSRSSRLSRDLDLHPETLLNPNPTSYTTLLLEDIQNFHQTNNVPSSFSLPPCVSKACSILEAVADLNSTTSSNNLSSAFSEDRKCLATDDQSSKKGYNNGRKVEETRDPFVESEVAGCDDLMEPSFHKYVTVRRGGTLGNAEMEEEESSGSNSFVGSVQHNWGFSSSTASTSWEPNSAESTDRWGWTSRTKSREDEHNGSSGLHSKRQATAESEPGAKGLSGRRRDSGFGKVGAGKGLHPVAFVAAST